MSQLDSLVAAGAYLNAGHLDIYDGKHKRLGDVTPGGDLILTAEGEALAASLAVTGTQAEAEVAAHAESDAANHDAVAAEAAAIVASVS